MPVESRANRRFHARGNGLRPAKLSASLFREAERKMARPRLTMLRLACRRQPKSLLGTLMSLLFWHFNVFLRRVLVRCRAAPRHRAAVSSVLWGGQIMSLPRRISHHKHFPVGRKGVIRPSFEANRLSFEPNGPFLSSFPGGVFRRAVEFPAPRLPDYHSTADKSRVTFPSGHPIHCRAMACRLLATLAHRLARRSLFPRAIPLPGTVFVTCQDAIGGCLLSGAADISKSRRPEMHDDSTILRTFELTKIYPGDIAALRHCSLAISRQEIFGLLGPNGAGKTTLLRLILGFMRPSKGSAQVLGFDCWHQSLAVRQRIAFLPGDVRLFRQLSSQEFLDFMASLRGIPLPRGRTRTAYFADRLDLDLKRRIAQMSTGMRQKLAIVATLSADVPFIILDEPTSSLDPTVRQTLSVLLRELQAEGKTILLSSHVLAEVEDLCQRVGIMRAGQLVIDQRMDELKQQYRITGRLSGPWKAPPLDLQVTIRQEGEQLTMYSGSRLPELLPWLASLPLTTLAIEPMGLRSVYEQVHGPVPSPTPWHATPNTTELPVDTPNLPSPAGRH